MFQEVRHLDVPEIEADEFQYDKRDIPNYRHEYDKRQRKTEAEFRIKPDEYRDCYQERVYFVLYLLFLF